MRRIENRTSIARSRKRKTDTFESLQRELTETKNVIEVLRRQPYWQNGGRELVREQPGAPSPPYVIAVPHDLRTHVNCDCGGYGKCSGRTCVSRGRPGRLVFLGSGFFRVRFGFLVFWRYFGVFLFCFVSFCFFL